ncbi:MAG: hypothetical protein KIT73_01735 [Burkholderiales bacterium]|nr:hypothetical protein [Burkholderiales bacterium]
MPRTLVVLLAMVSSLCMPPCARAQSPDARPAPPQNSIADSAEHARAARRAFDDVILLYESSDLAGLRSRLDPGFIGHQRFLDGVQRDFAAQRLVRIHLLEPRITAGADVAAIQVSWEKRFVDAQRFEPRLLTGTMIVLMHRTTSGWQLAAIQGDDPFGTHRIQPQGGTERRRTDDALR